MKHKVKMYKEGHRSFEDIFEVYRGWQAYAKWGNTRKLREDIKIRIIKVLLEKI